MIYTAAALKNLLLDDIKALAHCPEKVSSDPGKYFSRKRKMPAEDVLRFMLFMYQDNIDNELLNYYNKELERLPYSSAFYQQRKKLAPDVFRHLLTMFTQHLVPTLYNHELVLTAIDGTSHNLFFNPDDPDTFIAPNRASPRGHNEVHVIAALRISDRIFSDAVIQPSPKKNEYAAMCELVKRDNPSKGIPLYLADMGFASYNVFAHCIEKKSFFLIRANELRAQRILRSDMPSDGEFDVEVDRIIVRHMSKTKYSRPGRLELYRHIDKYTDFDFVEYGSMDEYPIHLRIVRIKLQNGEYEYLITNLPADRYGNAHLRLLYYTRWQIELSIRELKHVVGSLSLHSRKLVNVTHEILAKLVLYDFCSSVTAIAIEKKKGTKHEHQVNFSTAIKNCHDYLCQPVTESPFDIIAIIKRFTLPIRRERNFPRNKRFQVPLKFTYRH